MDKAVQRLAGPRFGVPPQPGVGFIPERERPDESTQDQAIVSTLMMLATKSSRLLVSRVDRCAQHPDAFAPIPDTR